MRYMNVYNVPNWAIILYIVYQLIRRWKTITTLNGIFFCFVFPFLNEKVLVEYVCVEWLYNNIKYQKILAVIECTIREVLNKIAFTKSVYTVFLTFWKLQFGQKATEKQLGVGCSYPIFIAWTRFLTNCRISYLWSLYKGKISYLIPIHSFERLLFILFFWTKINIKIYHLNLSLYIDNIYINSIRYFKA